MSRDEDTSLRPGATYLAREDFDSSDDYAKYIRSKIKVTPAGKFFVCAVSFVT